MCCIDCIITTNIQWNTQVIPPYELLQMRKLIVLEIEIIGLLFYTWLYSRVYIG